MIFGGIDLGSTSIKIVLIDENKEIVAYSVAPGGSLFKKHAIEQFNKLLKENGISRDEVNYIVSTGYGRRLFDQADEDVNEITANAVGLLLHKEAEDVRTIINIGGQDSKVISIDENYRVLNFVMNDKCAAGTGKFMEMAAAKLEIGVDELQDYHFNAGIDIVEVNSTCAVFAESEIISILAKGVEKENIVAGIHHSIAKRISRLTKNIDIKPKILFDGGAAKNKGLLDALEEEFMSDVLVLEEPEITSAGGAALIAMDNYRNKNITL